MASVDNIESLWDTAVEKFQKTSGITIGGSVKDVKEKNNYTVDTVTVAHGESGSQEKIRKSFDCILNLGKTASDVIASTVFPPAAVCYQAIAFLVETVDVYQKYYRTRSVEEVLESLLPHLEDIEDTLKRGKEGARVSRALQRSIIKVLLGFIGICDVYAKIKRDAGSFLGKSKMILKAFVRYDSDISSYLDNINGVVKQISYTRISEMHNRTLQTDSDRQRDDQRKDIKQKLIFDHPRLSTSPWSTAHNEYRERFKLGTGAWLQNHAQFRVWSNTEEHCTHPVLFFVAPEGHGKSHLVSEAVDYLQWIHESSNPNSRVTVAYFYFENPRKSHAAKGKPALELTLYDALSAVIWQFAEIDVACRTFVHGKAGNHSSMDLWKNLIVGMCARNDPKRTLYVILDGIDQFSKLSSEESPKSQITELIKTIGTSKDTNPQVRMLLSCKENFLDGFEDEIAGVSSIVKLRQSNDDDIRIMVHAKMANVCDTWHDTPEIREWREDTEKTIVTEVDGDFVLLNRLFETIGKEAEMEEVDEIIHNQLVNRSMIIKYQLEKLDRTLNEQQINVLNEILAWALYMSRWPTIEQLITVLRFRFEKKAFRSLKRQINDLYSPVLEIEGESVITRGLYNFEDVNATSQAGQEDALSHPESSPLSASAAKDVTIDSEITLIQDIVNNILPAHLYQKFRFQQHFDQLRSQFSKGPNRRITYSFFEAHKTIASTCIQLMLGNDFDEKQRKTLDDYTAHHLLEHLSVVPPNKFDDIERAQMVGNLKLFFTDQIVIKKWLNAIKGRRHYDSWFYDFDQCFLWLTLLGADDISSDIQASMDLLAAPRRVIAQQWLRDHEWNTREALHMIIAFYNKCEKLRYDIRISEEIIMEAEQLAKDELGMDLEETPSSVHDIRIAESLLLIDRLPDTEPAEGTEYGADHKSSLERSIKRCLSALQNDEKNWRAFWCMAQAEEMMISVDEASKDHGSKALNAISCLEDKLLEKTFRLENKDIWENIVQKRWTLYDSQGTPEPDQIAACEKLLRVYPDHRQATERVLNMIDHVKELETFRMSFVSMLLDHADSEDVHRKFYEALQGHDKELRKAYSEALVRAHFKPDALMYLRYYFGLAMFYRSSSEQDVEIALSQWKLNADEDWKGKGDVMQILDASIERLVCGYISSAMSVKRRSAAREQTGKLIETVRKLKARKDTALGDDLHYLTILLCRLYVVSGQKDLARETIRNYITLGLALLSDDTELNDDEGFLVLSEAFRSLGDDTNAQTAKLARLTIKDFSGEWKCYWCDGGCGRGWTHEGIRDIWTCRDCLDTDFDNQCYNKRAEVISKHQLCSNHHEYLHYPKELAERARITKQGFVLVNGKEVPIKTWLQMIKQDYL